MVFIENKNVKRGKEKEKKEVDAKAFLTSTGIENWIRKIFCQLILLAYLDTSHEFQTKNCFLTERFVSPSCSESKTYLR